jgi:hypothetical protein
MRLSEYFGGIKIDSLDDDHHPHERINCKCMLFSKIIIELFEECLGVKLEQNNQIIAEPSPRKAEVPNSTY